MQIVQGEYYKTRDGRKVGPMELGQKNEPSLHWRAFDVTIDGYANAWFEDGRVYKTVEDSKDLISPWSEAPTSPVREVTKREIVDGTYSRVFVYKVWDMPKKVAVAFVKAGEEGHVDTPAFVLDATELRAAAAVLLELAGALE